MTFLGPPGTVETVVRQVASVSEERTAFITSQVKQIKDTQRNNTQLYEKTVSSLLLCLEIFDVVKGTSQDIVCELTLLDILLSLELSAIPLSQCTSYVHLCLDAVKDTAVAAIAAKTFSLTLDFSTATEFVRSQVEESMQWVSLPNSSHHNPRRVCGILVITEVALRIPMVILPKLRELFDGLWSALASRNVELRSHAIALFGLATKLLVYRAPAIRIEIYDYLLRQLKGNLASRARGQKIAGLLAFEPIVMNSTGISSAMRYEDLSILLVPFMLGGGSSNDVEMRELVFRCLVVLCRYSTALFVANQLKDTVMFVLDSIRRFLKQSSGFSTLSELIVIVQKAEFDPFVEETFTAITEAINNSKEPCLEALRCLSVVCKICLPSQMEVHVDTCIENVFKWGLSSQLIECMRDIIASSTPDYRAKLEESLLDLISVTLCGLPFRQQIGTQFAPHAASRLEPSEYQISVALDALMQFGFSNSEMMGDFLRDSVLPFISNSSAAVRNAAVYTIVKLLIPPCEKGDLSIARRICINTVVTSMFVTGLSDPNADVRTTVLGAFTEDFYPYLSEEQFLFRFYAALGDESINCRVAALEQLCLMAKYDPSHILPALREQMAVTVRLISSAFSNTTVQSGLLLLTALASKAPQFVVKFKFCIAEVLRPHFSMLKDRSPILLPFLHCCTAVATAIHSYDRKDYLFKEEVRVVCEQLELFPTDRTFHACRLSCLRFLSAALGPVVDRESPYRMYPRLFWLLSTILRRTDESEDIRLEAVRCVGIIGALDSHAFQAIDALSKENQSSSYVPVFTRITHSKCCSVVLRAIASILEPESAGGSSAGESLLRTCMQTVLNIAERCPAARPKMGVLIAPIARALCQMPSGRLFATVLYEYKLVLKCVGEAVLDHADIIYYLFTTVWEHNRACRFLAVRVLTTVASLDFSGNFYFRQRQAQLVPYLFDAINKPESSADLKYAILEYIVKHAESLQTCCEAVVTNILMAIQSPSSSADFINASLIALKVICTELYIDELAGAIVRSLLTCFSSDRFRTDQFISASIANNVMGVFVVLITDLQGDFLKHSPYVVQAMKSRAVTHSEFTQLNNDLAKGYQCTRSAKSIQNQRSEVAQLVKKCESIAVKSMCRCGEVWSYSGFSDDNKALESGDEDTKTLGINEHRILVWIKTLPLTKDEWFKWAHHFSLVILQESPYQVFRCASLPIGFNATPLVERSKEFTSDVLLVGFRGLWSFSSANLRSSIIEFFRQTFREAITSSTVPDETLTMILSMVEYMGHVGEFLSFSLNDLSECAWNRGMLAKALYWREAAYREDPAGTVESLISLYSELHMVDCSVGILNMASVEQRRSLLQSSLVKLARYTEALELTQQELEHERADMSESSSRESVSRLHLKGGGYRAWARMRHFGSSSDIAGSFSRREDFGAERRFEATARLMLCLSELGNFDKVLAEWDKMISHYNGKENESEEGSILYYVSQYAADAAIRLQSWETLSQVLHFMPQDTVIFHIATASLNVVNEQYSEAAQAITEGRKMLLDDLSGLLHESYARAYEGLVMAQELTEVEEVIQAKRAQRALCSSDHISVVAKLWDQRSRMMSTSVSAWKQLLGVRGLLIPPSQDVKTRIRFVKLCRQEHAKQLAKFTLDQLLGYTDPTLEELTDPSANPRVVMQYITFLSLSNELGPESTFGTESELLKRMIDVHSGAENNAVLSRAYARLGTKSALEEATDCYKTSTLYDPKWYMAWRLWAKANAGLLGKEYTDTACANAIDGYIRSIQLGTSDSTLIQDVLKLLTLWSRHCDREQNLRELRNRVLDVPSRVWHLVVPQLIARLDSGSDDSCHLVANILTNVSYSFPHTLTYPLNLCTMSNSERRKRWASEILSKLEVKYPEIVRQGRMMITELIRLSSLIYEQWYEKLEGAATAFFGRHRRDGMLRLLIPMHETLTRPPETIMESEFVARYGKDLAAASEWLRSYTITRSVSDLQAAWFLYHGVYRKIDEQIKASNVLQLQFCTPKLFEARDLAIGIPDARPAKEEAVSMISSFEVTVHVITSKQRPKRIGITTVAGTNMKFLLKGKEDLRLDERVMQLFGLVNILMLSDSRSCNNFGFQIQRYSVTPLKDTAGLIGWVDGCDTLHELVHCFREQKGIPVEVELRMLNQIISFDNAKAYDHLSIMSKVEVMEFLADHTSGHDIQKAMWSAAPNCEIWLDQRHMYRTSLANMSVVGYILGLGDRHPNNIMIQRTSGLVVHIDFGDCFEVAMTRDKFPEKVPFRLTRMLRNALDASGVDGAYRADAETAMCVLRESSDSVLALMEAFIQDPLISWRLVNRPGQEPESSTDHKTIEEQVRIADMHKVSQSRHDSVLTLGEAGKRVSCSAAVHLFGEEIDVVHQGVFIFNRLRSKLRGEDFLSGSEHRSLEPHTQVNHLIAEATDLTNIAQSWSGWYPFW